MSAIISKSGRAIGTVIPDLTISEDTHDDYEITSHPVQQGANINDHKYKKPVALKMTIIQSANNGSLADRYSELLALQDSAALFTVTTPKRNYANMQIKSLAVTTNADTENILSVVVDLQQITIVNVTTASVPAQNQRNASKTNGIQNAGTKSATPAPAQKKSALQTLLGGLL